MIKKAVITAAGKGTRHYPATNSVQKELFTLVDRDGITKPVIQIIAEEALSAGIQEICIVVQPGMQENFKNHFRCLTEKEKTDFKNKKWGLDQSELLNNLQQAIVYVEQTVQEGYGHAVYCAREWTGNDPFLLMLGDHLYISDTEESCANQLIKSYKKFNKSVYALKQTHIEQIYLFGTVTGNKISDIPPAYELTRVIEKPEASFARKYLYTPELPNDYFLCFFGMHILTPTIFKILEDHINQNLRERGEIQLTTAQSELVKTERAVGVEINGRRLDMGTPIGYLETQMALTRKGVLAADFERAYASFRT